MGKRRGQGEGREDQFGEVGGSQDKNQFSGFNSGRGLTGGGSAGGSRKGGDVSYQRQVPKFLQRYSHLLGKTAADEDEPVVVGGPKGAKPDEEEEDDQQEDNLEVDALKRAIADNPELAAEFQGQLDTRLKQAEAAEEKERGNSLFAKKKFEEAAKSFSKCIELDPSCEVYWSNRSASYASLEQWGEAAADARRVVALKPGWAKGWARLGAALMGQKLYGDAREAYEKALTIEPDDQALRKAAEKAESMELQQMRDGKHTFKKMRTERGPSGGSGAEGAGRAGGRREAGVAAAAAGPAVAGPSLQLKNNQNKKILSFAADEDEDA